MSLSDVLLLISTISAIISAVYAAISYHKSHKTSENANEVARSGNFSIPFQFLLAAIAWGAVIYGTVNRDQDGTPINAGIIQQWGLEPQGFRVLIDANKISKYKDKFVVFLITRVNYADIDSMTDKFIAKSSIYTIQNGYINLAISHNSADNKTRFSTIGQNTVEYYVALLPNNISPDRILSLSDVECSGGKIVESHSQIIPAAPVIPNSPAPSQN